jgi:aspartate aminotransferase
MVKKLRARLKDEGKPDDVISLTLGEPDFSTPQHISDAAIKALNDKFTHYTSSYGIPELREAIAEKTWFENKIPCENKNIMVTPTKLGIFSTIMALVDKDDEVLVPDPCWVSYIPCIKLAQGKPVLIPTVEDENFAVTPERVIDLIKPKTKLIILNSPSNPTGNVATLEELKGIADLAADNDTLVLTDEIYEKIIYEGTHHSIASLPGMFDRTVTVNGFSKSYAMTGWRLGWIVAPKPLLNEIAKIQQHSLTCATSFAQYGGLAALKGDQKCIEEMVNEFKARVELAVNELNAIDGIHTASPHGAFYVFFGYDIDKPSADLVELFIDKAHVSFTPGSEFGPSGEKHIRMSCAISQEKIKEAIRRIGKVIEEL